MLPAMTTRDRRHPSGACCSCRRRVSASSPVAHLRWPRPPAGPRDPHRAAPGPPVSAV